MADDRPAPALALPAPRQPSGPYRVSLICLGNICRSPMAEAVLRDELARAGLDGAVTVDSAGTGDWHIGERMDRGALAELARHGHDGAGHRVRQFQPEWFDRYDLILAMDRANLTVLRSMAPPADRDRIALFRSFDPAAGAGGDPHRGEVPDPYGGPAEWYTRAFELIVPAARGLTAALAGRLGVPGAGRPPRR